MKQTLNQRFNPVARWILLVAFMALTNWSEVSNATDLFTFDDMEKPKPEFSRTGDIIAAKLIPRAKNTSVVIRFGVAAGGKLDIVKGVDFQTVDRPEVNVKNFKSAAFEIRISNVAPGAEAKVSIRSDFFSSSTAFYAFNPKLEKTWLDTHALNLPQPERVRELLVTVRDGGPLDADGAADGNIILIGGPRDGFWGYALGTLFIRFFGIFLVLSILMIGMILSGFVFRRYDRRKNSSLKDSGDKRGQESVEQMTMAASEEEVAAIAAALHLQFRHSRASAVATSVSAPVHDGLWAAEGRKRIMTDRFTIFNRLNRFSN